MRKAREQEVFSREDTPTEERVRAAFLYYVGLSYRRVGELLGYSHEAVRQWYHQLAELFEPEPDDHQIMTVDETTVRVEETDVSIWAAVDVQTPEAIHVEASPGRSELDALLFLQTVLERCRGRPTILVDRGPWYNWALDDLHLDCVPGAKPGAIARLSKPGLACSSTGRCYSTADFRRIVPGSQLIAGRKYLLPFTIHSANVDTLPVPRP